MKKFDLNIEKILEDWEVRHAIREVIANAIDEQKLSNSEEIKIFKDSSCVFYFRFFVNAVAWPCVYSFRGLEAKLSGQPFPVQSGTTLAHPCYERETTAFFQ